MHGGGREGGGVGRREGGREGEEGGREGEGEEVGGTAVNYGICHHGAELCTDFRHRRPEGQCI